MTGAKCRECGVMVDAPTYSGLCRDCNNRLLNDSWQPIPVCPECDQERLRWFGDMCLQCAVNGKTDEEINRLSRKAAAAARRGEELSEAEQATGDVLQGFSD